MTLQQLVDHYEDPFDDGNHNHLFGVLKVDDLFKESTYVAHTPHCETIYNYCYDGRRGVWINKYVEDNELQCVQVAAGREGDDAIVTFILSREWLANLADTYDSTVDIDDEYDVILFFSNEDLVSKDISEILVDSISGYGTSCSEKPFRIEQIVNEVTKQI